MRLAKRFLGPEVSRVGHLETGTIDAHLPGRPDRLTPDPIPTPTPQRTHHDRHRDRRPRDGRTTTLRPVTIERGWSAQAEGSALISFGSTKVLCTASFTNGVPALADRQGQGLGHRRVRDAAPRRRTPAWTARASRARSAAAPTRSRA